MHTLNLQTNFSQTLLKFISHTHWSNKTKSIFYSDAYINQIWCAICIISDHATNYLFKILKHIHKHLEQKSYKNKYSCMQK